MGRIHTKQPRIGDIISVGGKAHNTQALENDNPPVEEE